MDTGKYKEVAGNRYLFKYKGTELKILVHQSEQAWAPDFLDISEETTGYRFTSTNKPVSASTFKDVDKVLTEFIEEHTIEKILDKRSWFLKTSHREI